MKSLRTVAFALLLAIMVAVLVYYLGFHDQNGGSVDFDASGPMAVKLSILGIVFAAALVFARPGLRQVVNALVFWGGLAVVLLVGYSMRADLEDIARGTLATLVPGMAVNQSDGTVALARDSSGHYVVDARVDGAPVRFLIDTGASRVTLTSADAVAAGIDTSRLFFGARVSTANGITRVAPVRLDTIAIAGARLSDVSAFVAQPGALDTSLFGMNALDRFSSWKVEGERMVLTP